jgi:hypothetical protein
LRTARYETVGLPNFAMINDPSTIGPRSTHTLTTSARAAAWDRLHACPELHSVIGRRAGLTAAQVSTFYRTGRIGVVALAKLARAMGGDVVVVFRKKARR